MLYSFEKLKNKLSELGYPESNVSGFRVIKRDFTQEEKAGNIFFKEDRIFLKIDGKEYKGYMYLKYPDIERFDFPKFHITNCQTIRTQKSSINNGINNFDNRYFWHNSNVVNLEDRETKKKYENQQLQLCGFCKREADISDFDNTEGFFNLLDQQEQEYMNEKIEVDIFGYKLDWQKISKAYKIEKQYTCESCNIIIEKPIDRRYIHVHHKSGNKLNNARNNLECLCILCHANQDDKHVHNFEKKRMQIDIESFLVKYKVDLIRLQNRYLSKYL